MSVLYTDFVRNRQESGLKVNHPASFAVRLNGAKGKMDAKVHSPSGALEKCVVTELERGVCVCACLFLLFFLFVFCCCLFFLIVKVISRGFMETSIRKAHTMKSLQLTDPSVLSSRQVRYPVHPQGEWRPHHWCQIQWLSHPGKSFPGPSRGTRTDWRAWFGFSIRIRTGERNNRWVTVLPAAALNFSRHNCCEPV